MSRNGYVVAVVAALLAVAAVGSGAVATSPATAGTGGTATTDDATSTISLTASGSVEARPDEAVVRVSVTAVATDPETARAAVARNVSALRSALENRGLGEDAVRTTNFGLRRLDDSQFDDYGIRRGPAYRASHSLAVVTGDTGRAGEIVGVATDAGGATVDSVGFRLSDETRRDLRERALRRAVANARSQATVIAAESDLTVAGVGSVSTRQVSVPRYATRAVAAGGAADAPTDVSPGPATVSASVHVVFNASRA